MKRYCNICNKKVSLTSSRPKMAWEDSSYCRACKYMMEVFAWNGNYLKEYTDKVEWVK
jgi:hypothetical protein|tara:strand:- start:1543 stop:1716 length:174 start_codon:yes stop_codon:yes gene_type:complete